MAAAGVGLPACPEEAATAPGGPSCGGTKPGFPGTARRGRGAPERGPLGRAAGWDRKAGMSKGENRDGRDVLMAVKYHPLQLQEPRRSGLEIKPGRPVTERRRVIRIPPSVETRAFGSEIEVHGSCVACGR